VPKTPGSLEEALQNPRKDHEFLLLGDVFTADVIDTWIWYKSEKEVDAIRLRPHPHELYLLLRHLKNLLIHKAFLSLL
jgi:glutamine synthetase